MKSEHLCQFFGGCIEPITVLAAIWGLSTQWGPRQIPCGGIGGEAPGKFRQFWVVLVSEMQYEQCNFTKLKFLNHFKYFEMIKIMTLFQLFSTLDYVQISKISMLQLTKTNI